MNVIDWYEKYHGRYVQRRESKVHSMYLYNADAPLERFAIDVAVPVSISFAGNKNILVITDYFLEWARSVRDDK